MASFREENRFLIFYVNIFGLYLKSIEFVTRNKWLIAFFTVWTKIPMAIFPIYIAWDIRSLLFDEVPLLLRHKIEGLINLWDASFKEILYPEELKANKENNKKQNLKLVRVSMFLAVVASLIYSVPAYFSKNKKFIHPSGIVYPLRYPEFEIVVTFDVCASLSCVSAAAFDCILIVLLSHVRSKLTFLKDTLTDLISTVIIDKEGRVMCRQREEGNRFQGDICRGSFFKSGSYVETEFESWQFKQCISDLDIKLRIWIHHHQQTIRFFEEIKTVYSGVATVELVYIVSYTALTALHLVQVKPNLVALGIALVASSNLMSLFLWSKLGADVESIHVFSDAFGQAWFLFPKKIQTAFSFIIMRSKKSLTLFGISIYAVNLVTFFEIMKLTYQFFAFMAQITE